MLILDLKQIGNKLYEIRTKKLLTRAEVADRARLSDRTYADIERGSVNMRIETVLRICGAMRITPNDIFVEKETEITERDILTCLQRCSAEEKEIALQLIQVYLSSLN